MRKIEERWQALEPAPDVPVFQLVDATHPLNLYIGRAITGEYLFLLVDTEAPPKIGDLRSVRTSVQQKSDGQWTLLLSLVKQELTDVFALLCEDLVESTRHLARGSSGTQLIARRLASWRRLLEQGNTGLLTPEQVRGLVAELLVLDCYFIGRLGAVDAANAWVGPLNADQDFQLATEAWEVKSIRADASSVRIASEDQLYSETRDIHLVVLQLNEASGTSGYSLNDLVSRVRTHLDNQPLARDVFDDRLTALGYVTRSEYDAPRYSAGAVRAFHVHGAFPRITSKALPKGVTEVRYHLQLDECTPYEIAPPFSLY